MSEEDFKNKLSPSQYKVLRERATEAPFTGKYNLHFEAGVYRCGACHNELFSSEGKYDAGCGWPSFHTPIDNDRILTKKDFSHNRERTEILCKKCESHLGHVFNDGPTGQRYCVNSLSLDFSPKDT